MRSSSIQVWWPCRRPCGVKPVSTGSHDATDRSAAGGCPDPSQRPAPALCAMTQPSSRRGQARPQTAHRPVAASLTRRTTPRPAGGWNSWPDTAAATAAPAGPGMGRPRPPGPASLAAGLGLDTSRQQLAGRTVHCSSTGGSGPGPGQGTHSGRRDTTVLRCSGRCTLGCPRASWRASIPARNCGRSAGRIEPSLAGPR